MKTQKSGSGRQEKKGLVFVVSGPSGSGKTTLLSRLSRDRAMKKVFAKSVSLTTRPPRSKERNGRDYFFVSTKDFLRLRRQKKLLEWTRFLGYYYATPREFVERQLRAGRNIFLCLDIRGGRSIKRAFPRQSVTIFILPPALGELKKRIQKRCGNTRAQEIAWRLGLAAEELSVAKEYDYCLLNDSLKRATDELKGIVNKEIRLNR